MKTDSSRRNFFNHRALAGFVLFCAVVAALIAMHSRWIGMASALIYLAALVIGSVVLVVHNLKRRGRPGQARLGQMGALPRRWRRWVLDEDAGKEH